MSKWFNEKSAEGLNEKLLEKLDQARDIAGIPFVITSGLRSSQANQSIAGAVEDSSHLSGLGVDLRASTSTERFKIVEALLRVGFTRMGIYDRHVHIDCDRTKPQGVLWIGLSH